MKRRSFLGLILAGGAAPAIVRSSSLMKMSNPTERLILPNGLITMREIRTYDIKRDTFITRWDVAGDIPGRGEAQFHLAVVEDEFRPLATIGMQREVNSQLGIDHPWSAHEPHEFSYGVTGIEQRRARARQLLKAMADESGLLVVKGRLELPIGLQHAEFV